MIPKGSQALFGKGPRMQRVALSLPCSDSGLATSCLLSHFRVHFNLDNSVENEGRAPCFGMKLIDFKSHVIPIFFIIQLQIWLVLGKNVPTIIFEEPLLCWLSSWATEVKRTFLKRINTFPASPLLRHVKPTRTCQNLKQGLKMLTLKELLSLLNLLYLKFGLFGAFLQY